MGKCKSKHRCTTVVKQEVSALRGYTQKHRYSAELQSQNPTDLRPGHAPQHKTLHEVHGPSERVISGPTAGICTRGLNEIRGRITGMPWRLQ